MATTVFNRTVSRKQPTAVGRAIDSAGPAIHAGKTVFATSPCAAASNRRASTVCPLLAKVSQNHQPLGLFQRSRPPPQQQVSSPSEPPRLIRFLIKEEGLGLVGRLLNKHRLIANHFRTVDGLAPVAT